MKLTMIGCGMAVKRMGILEVSASKMKALTEDENSDTEQ